MQIDAPNRDFPRRCEKQGGMAQSVEHIVHIDGVVGSSPTVTTENRITFAVVLFFCQPSSLFLTPSS